MFSLTRCLLAISLLPGLLVLAGCPQQPSLSVTPLSLDFGTADTLRSFRIRNQGGGTLDWTAQTAVPWLSIEQSTLGGKQSTVSGSATTEVDVIQIRVDRAQLPLGSSTTQVSITSNGGSQTVAISVQQTSPAQLTVSTNEVNLGSTADQATFNITNNGNERLTWNLQAPPNTPWLTVLPTEGGLDAGRFAEISVRVNRTLLPGGESTATVNITSNDGNASVLVRVNRPPFSVTPASIAFGTVSTTASQNLTVRNNRTVAATITAQATPLNGTGWLSVAPGESTIPANGTAQTVVTVNAAALEPGAYEGEIVFTDATANVQQTVGVSMQVTALSVSTAEINFGAQLTPVSQDFQIENRGSTPVAFTINVPQADTTWLSVTPAGGEVSGQRNITVEINPAAVVPGNYDTTLRILYEGGEAAVRVRFSKPRPATLRVEPNTIDFGGTRIQELIGIWNDGLGVINWQIDTTGFPVWLSLSPTDAQGIASGSVSGSQTDTVTLQLHRNLAPAGVFQLAHTFEITATGDDAATIEVSVRAEVPVIPVIELLSDGVDETGVAFLNYDVNVTEKQVVIRNNGNGPLTWSFNMGGVPNYITSISPQQGSLQPQTQQTVTVRISRLQLTFLGAQHTLSINSNDPNRPNLPLLVEIQVAKRPLIGVQPSTLAFGANQNAAIIEVANVGDPETILNFRVTPSKDWLAAFPETGRSVGTAGAIKDLRPISVSVDRSRLEGSGVSAQLVVSAYEVINGQIVPREDVPPITVNVSAEAAELTIESAKPRGRIPSLVRNTLMLRNLRYQSIPIPEARLAEIGDQFRLFEEDQAIEISETNQFLTSGSKLKTNVLIMLDYSGSMMQTAQRLADAGLLPIPGGMTVDDPLQFIYEQCITPLILEMPEHYRIAIGVFNDRTPFVNDKVRIIRETPTAPRFIRDKQRLLNRLASIMVEDNGATELLPAIARGAEILIAEDGDFVMPFDDADVRALVCITDGRLTTPPGNLNDVLQFLVDYHVRFMPVGWGESVAADPLIRIAGPSGGHYYSTRTQPTGELDPFGTPIRRPIFEELLAWCFTNPNDPCDQSIAKDLQSQVALTYTTLREETSVRIEGRVAFDDPNDGPRDPQDPDSACLPDQGTISGSFDHQNIDLFSIAGDNRLGQISLNASRIENGEAHVTVRLEYAPRNVRRFTFLLQNAGPGTADMQVVRTPLISGGVIPNWTQTVQGNQYTFASPDNTPLGYGEFGSLLDLRFTNVTGDFTLLFNVLDPVENVLDPNTKYFLCPDALSVSSNYDFLGPEQDEFFMSAFPRPLLNLPFAPVSTSPITLDFGSAINNVDVGIVNIGGSYISPSGNSVGLGWSILDSEGTGILNYNPSFGFITSNTFTDTLRLSVDRSLAPGIYTNIIYIQFTLGSIPYFFNPMPLAVRYTVLPTALDVTPLQLDFGDNLTALPLTVSNTGQGTMHWSLDFNLFPTWLGTNVTSGTLGPEESTSFNIVVRRENVPAGVYQYPMRVEHTSGGSTQFFIVDVQMTVL